MSVWMLLHIQVIPGNSIIKWAMGSNVLLSHWIISNIKRMMVKYHIKAWEIFFCVRIHTEHPHNQWWWKGCDSESHSYTENPPPGCRNNILCLQRIWEWFMSASKTTTRSQEYEIFDTKFNEFWCRMLTTGLINLYFHILRNGCFGVSFNMMIVTQLPASLV